MNTSEDMIFWIAGEDGKKCTLPSRNYKSE